MTRLPPDPALVEFDLQDYELPELPMEDFEPLDDEPIELQVSDFEPLDSEPPAMVAAVPMAAPVPLLPPLPNQGAVVVPMVVTFMGSALLAMMLALLPWFVWVSPSLQASRDARVAARAVQPAVIEVPVPVMVQPPAPLVEEPEVEEVPVEEALPPEVMARSQPRPRKPAPKKAEVPAPKEVKAAAPEPVPVAPTRFAGVPEQARLLAGTLNGTADGKSMTMRLEFLPNGKLKARINRADVGSRSASGSYTVTGKRATFALVERGNEAASYAGTVSNSGASGRITLADGSKGRLKVRR